MAKAKQEKAPQPQWERLFCMIWKRLKENRTSEPTTIMSTPVNHADVNYGKFKGYELFIQFSSSPFATFPENYVASIRKGKRDVISMHHRNGVTTGKTKVTEMLTMLVDEPDYNLVLFGGKNK